MISTQKISKYKDTQWKRIRAEDMVIETDQKDPVAIYKAELTGGGFVVPNISFLPEKKRDASKYFLMDHDDYEHASKLYAYGKKDLLKVLMFFGEYLLKVFGKRKTIYLRAICPLRMSTTEEVDDFGTGNKAARVFAEEVFDVIQLARLQQNEKFAKDDTKLIRLGNKWNSESGYYQTITLTEMNKVLDEFEVDKSLITVIDDPGQITASKMTLQSDRILKILSYDNCLSVDIPQCILYAVKSLIVGIKWEKVSENSKLNIITPIWDCRWQCKEGLYSIYDHIVSQIKVKKMEHLPIYKSTIKRPDFFMISKSPEENVDSDIYIKMAEEYGLKMFQVFREDDQVPVFVMRTLVVMGFLDSLELGSQMDEFRNFVIGAMLTMVPVDSRPLIKEYLINSAKEPLPEKKVPIPEPRKPLPNPETSERTSEIILEIPPPGNPDCPNCEANRELEVNMIETVQELQKQLKLMEPQGRMVFGTKEGIISHDDQIKELEEELLELEELGEEYFTDSTEVVRIHIETADDDLEELQEEIREAELELETLLEANKQLLEQIEQLEKELEIENLDFEISKITIETSQITS
ncbi:unnamed protein product [Caenorhabditis nigoni]